MNMHHSVVWPFLCALGAADDWTHQGYTAGVFIRSPATHELKSKAQQVSDPASVYYGQYLSQEQLRRAVAVPDWEARQAASWLRAALSEDGSRRSDPHIAKHGDAVTILTESFFATYSLGVALMNGKTFGVELPNSAYFLLTPPMPGKGLCNSLGKSDCVKPCAWNSTCKGDFAGWNCWRSDEAQFGWRCFEPNHLDGLEEDVKVSRKQQRRGRHLGDIRAAPGGPVDHGFHVIPRSEGLILVFRVPMQEMLSGRQFRHRNWLMHNLHQLRNRTRYWSPRWETVELTLQQGGLYHNQVFQWDDFIRREEDKAVVTYYVQVQGLLRNLRPAHKIAVCLDVGPRRDQHVPPVADAGSAGCICNATTGRDQRLGRPCQPLPGLGPDANPVDFILPRAPQTLSKLRADLGLPSFPMRAAPEASQAVAQFLLESFSQEDVQRMHEAYGVGVRRPEPIYVHGFQGSNETLEKAGEGSLDVQTISLLAPGASTWWWGVSPRCLDSFMIAYALQLNDHAYPPLVHSISWGDAEAGFPSAFVETLDYLLMKLTLRGITMIAASGDNGISAVNAGCNFLSDIIASSPWVTAVGATMPSLEAMPYCRKERFSTVLGNCDEMGAAVCSVSAGALITSSGYFSVYRHRPSYQDSAVGAWLDSSACKPCRAQPGRPEQASHIKVPCQHVSEDSRCRLESLVRYKRAAPDVSLPGQAYPTMVNGSIYSFDGTSASAPALAALVSLLNTEQLSRSRPPLGLLNPWLYSTWESRPDAFVDVIVGDTSSTERAQCTWGWNAGPGWDPASGLGVPRFSVLMGLLPDSPRQHHNQDNYDNNRGNEELSNVPAGMAGAALCASVAFAAGLVATRLFSWRSSRVFTFGSTESLLSSYNGRP